VTCALTPDGVRPSLSRIHADPQPGFAPPSTAQQAKALTDQVGSTGVRLSSARAGVHNSVVSAFSNKDDGDSPETFSAPDEGLPFFVAAERGRVPIARARYAA